MQDYFSYLFQAISDLLNQNASFLEGMGMNIFRALAIIMVSWFGVQSALSSAGGGGGANWPKFSALLQGLLICYTMLSFYTVPIPGFGISFTHLILDEVQSLTATLNLASVQHIVDSLNGLETNIPYPSGLEILAIGRFLILLIAIIAAQAVTLAVVMYGYVAVAVIMLVGPIFIPFKIVPQMEWMFWNWLRSFLQYSFYQLIAAAYVFVFGEFLQNLLGAKNTPMSASDMAYQFVPLLLTLVVFIIGLTTIPSLTFSIFAGRAGEYILPRWK
jgi:hypothetical protein